LPTRMREEKSAFKVWAAKATDCRRGGKPGSRLGRLWILLSLPFMSGVPWTCQGHLKVGARFKSWSTPPFCPLGSYHLCFLYLLFQDFTSSQSWSVESSTSDSPPSIAIIKEISESLLTAGSCSPARRKQSEGEHSATALGVAISVHCF
jgi:hypothetical protein